MKLTKIKKDGELNYNVNNVGNNLMNGSKLAKYWKGKKFRSQAFTQTKIEDIENHINSANTVNKFGLKALTFGNWLTEQDKIEQIDLNNKNEMIKTFAQLFQKLFYDEKGNETKFLKSLHKASPYYRKRAEIFARTSEVYISLKRKRENSILAKDKYRYNASIYPKPELVEKVEPLLDKIFLAYVKK